MNEPTSTTIADLLADRLDDHADDVFLMFEGEETSYREVIERAAAFAGGLERAGVTPGDRVAVLLPNTPEFLYVWFGNALAGAVTVPMNPAYTPDEIRYILENSEASAIVTFAGKRPDIDSIGNVSSITHRVLVGDGASAPWTGYESFLEPTPFSTFREPGRRVAAGDPASIIYTSGTTGHPKGVVLSHGSYVFDSWSLVEHIHNDHRDRFMCFLPLFHVNAQVVSVLSALYVGGRLVLLREFKPTTFFETLAETGATTFSAVPTVYAILNTLPDADRYDLSSLRYCVCGAAPMPVEVFETFERRFGATIVEGYGLSEATCGNCVNPAGTDAVRKIGSIGIPLPGQEMAVADDAGAHLPDGEVGELLVRGPALMKEYFGNPDATAEALRNGWLHTGDLGYRDPDGYYFIVGRKKEMIIRGGINVYPKEIEEVIYRHDAVQEAAVVGEPNDIWGETVCACVVPKPGTNVDPESVLDLCRGSLAAFKVPERVVVLPEFPKTPTGKIQKNRIPLPPSEE